MGFLWTTENKTGTDCSGTDGAKNRVLTLSNTGQTKQPGFLVYASGLALALTTEYTVTHNETSTTITFLNKMFNYMEIIVNYYQSSSLEYVTARNDFQTIVQSDGQTGTLIRQTKTTDGLGGLTGISTANYTIVTVLNDITKKDRQIIEMGLAVPGNIKAFLFHEYNDSITGNGTVVIKVGDIYQETSGKQWRVIKITGERYINGFEIFRVGVLRNINLEE